MRAINRLAPRHAFDRVGFPFTFCLPSATPAVVGFARLAPAPASSPQKEPPMALVPLNLLVTHNGKSKRQHVTCVYKCGDACSKPVRNTSDNEYFGDVVKAVSRRSMLQAGGIAVLAVGAGSALAACGTDEQAPGRAGHSDVVGGARRDTARHEVQLGRAQQRGRRRRRRRLRASGGDQLGRPRTARRAEVRRRQAKRRRSARSVRLQQRLRRALCPSLDSRTASYW